MALFRVSMVSSWNIALASSASMRAPSVFSSLIGIVFHSARPKAVTERQAVVKHETFAAPAALGFRHAFQVFQDSALEVVDLGKTARQQIARGLFAANAAGAEHRDPPVFRGIEVARGKILELAEAFDAGIDGAGKCAHRDLEGIAGVD